MTIGDRVYTPRFCTVTIKAVYEDRKDAYEAGYTEQSYYSNPEYGIVGRSIDLYHMEFAAYKK